MNPPKVKNSGLNIYKERILQKQQKEYNPFTLSNGVSYDFETSKKMNQRTFQKFSMSLKTRPQQNPPKHKSSTHLNDPSDRKLMSRFGESNFEGGDASSEDDDHMETKSFEKIRITKPLGGIKGKLKKLMAGAGAGKLERTQSDYIDAREGIVGGNGGLGKIHLYNRSATDNKRNLSSLGKGAHFTPHISIIHIQGPRSPRINSGYLILDSNTVRSKYT